MDQNNQINSLTAEQMTEIINNLTAEQMAQICEMPFNIFSGCPLEAQRIMTSNMLSLKAKNGILEQELLELVNKPTERSSSYFLVPNSSSVQKIPSTITHENDKEFLNFNTSNFRNQNNSNSGRANNLMKQNIPSMLNETEDCGNSSLNYNSGGTNKLSPMNESLNTSNVNNNFNLDNSLMYNGKFNNTSNNFDNSEFLNSSSSSSLRQNPNQSRFSNVSTINNTSFTNPNITTDFSFLGNYNNNLLNQSQEQPQPQPQPIIQLKQISSDPVRPQSPYTSNYNQGQLSKQQEAAQLYLEKLYSKDSKGVENSKKSRDFYI